MILVRNKEEKLKIIVGYKPNKITKIKNINRIINSNRIASE